MSKEIYIHCDGGFGNRFNSLVVGLLIAKVANYKPIILWPSTNWCRSSFNSLFDYDANIIEDSLLYFSQKYDDYQFIMHNNFLHFSVPVYHPNAFHDLSSLVEFIEKSNFDKVVYNNDSIPNYCFCDELYEVISDLKFCDNIVSDANNFIKENNLLEKFYGVHLRNTDFYDPHKPDFDSLHQLVLENSNEKYFICSDDKELEDKFNCLENTYVYSKTNYVEKLTEDGEWRSVIVDDTGVEYPFNVERSDDSVKQAMIDLYILSKSDIIKTSNSSFLQTAILLQKSYNGQK